MNKVVYMFQDRAICESFGNNVVVPVKGDIVQIKGELYTVDTKLISIRESNTVVCAYLR